MSVCSHGSDDTASMVGGLQRLKARAEASSKLNQHNKGKFSSWRTSAVVGSREEWALPDLLAQDILCINESLSGFQPRSVEVIGQLCYDPMTIPTHRTDDEISV